MRITLKKENIYEESSKHQQIHVDTIIFKKNNWKLKKMWRTWGRFELMWKRISDNHNKDSEGYRDKQS